MKTSVTLIKPRFEIITPLSQIKDYPRQIELAGRTCYKSERKIRKGSSYEFITMLIALGHESVLEHCSITVRIFGDRSMSHQLVRHRIAAYSQESQRYCDYRNSGLQVVMPLSIADLPIGEYVKKGKRWYRQHESGKLLQISKNKPLACLWLDSVQNAYTTYQHLINNGVSIEDARSVLPNATKTEIVTTYNLRQWRHVFHVRAVNPKAQREIREIMLSILARFVTLLPPVFSDLDRSSIHL